MKKINTISLIKEIVNRDVLAKYPDPFYETKQFSSYDRTSITKDSSSWYANWDRSQFLRVDSMNGRREFVVMDAEGPGAITRFWATVADYSGKGILRFYLDHNTSPEIEGEVLSILSGDFLTDAPLSTSVSEQTDYIQRGHNLYLPIPYSKHCKITYESPSIKEPGEHSGECFYYSINYRTYPEETTVETFSKENLIKNKTVIAGLQKELLLSQVDTKGLKENEAALFSLDSQEAKKLSLKGPGAIRRLDIKLYAEDFEQALRSTILCITFDGNKTVWVPIGDFFGSGNRFSPYQTYYTKVSSDSVFSCFWVMPYQDNCNITLENVAIEPLKASFTAYTSDWNWDNRSMYFGAGWTEYQHLYTGKTRNMYGTKSQFDVNFVELSGKGVYVGDGVTLFNSIADWWGEGDEKIYVDGESFPSHFGTGTEDYYGYAWCMHNFFEHPFIAQPDGTGATQCGHVSNVRYRALDAIPFKESLVFDMEIWHWGSTYINFAPTTFWYMLPQGKSNRKEEVNKAAAIVAKHKNDLVNNIAEKNKLVEGEYLNIHLTGGVEKSQSIPAMNWSNGAQFLWIDANENDSASLKFRTIREGRYQMKVNITQAPDYGCFDIYLNNQKLKENVNLYSDKVITKILDLGVVHLLTGENNLQFIQRKADHRATNNLLGIDYIVIY